jgi:hypothetical protein
LSPQSRLNHLSRPSHLSRLSHLNHLSHLSRPSHLIHQFLYQLLIAQHATMVHMEKSNTSLTQKIATASTNASVFLLDLLASILTFL